MSSRSPRAGSIAADRTTRPRRPDWAVIPLTTSGLHCGTGYGMRCHCESASHPAHHERAPLRRGVQGPRSGAIWRSSRSPRAGSIAATHLGAGGKTANGVIPLTTSGLHCGEFAAANGHAQCESSRSPRAGSIAARGTVITGTAERTSSRSPRAGSIAASGPPARPGRSPASSRSPRAGSIAAAMARQYAWSSPESSRSPRAGSIAACSTRFTASAMFRVIPLTTSGLHCGTSTTSFAEELCRHPAHHERAPLRLVASYGEWTSGRSRHPAHHERAPLRQHQRRLIRARPSGSSRSPRADSIAAGR